MLCINQINAAINLSVVIIISHLTAVLCVAVLVAVFV